jgi:glycerate kinase
MEVVVMYRIVLEPDSFKESLTAPEVAKAIAVGIRRVFQDAEIMTVPVADGGEGLTDTLVAATGGTTGPLGTPVEAYWGLLGDSSTAVVEMAQASGLTLVPPELRNPMSTTTRGTGELISQALSAGCQKLIVGIGGERH